MPPAPRSRARLPAPPAASDLGSLEHEAISACRVPAAKPRGPAPLQAAAVLGAPCILHGNRAASARELLRELLIAGTRSSPRLETSQAGKDLREANRSGRDGLSRSVAFAPRVWVDAGRAVFVPGMKCGIRALHAVPLRLCRAATGPFARRRGRSRGSQGAGSLCEWGGGRQRGGACPQRCDVRKWRVSECTSSVNLKGRFCWF